MSIQGQCHFGQRSFFKDLISAERYQDQWSSGLGRPFTAHKR